MDCQEVQRAILESIEEPPARELWLAMEHHIATCEACGRFAQVQRALDARLGAAFPAVRPSPALRASLQARIRRDPVAVWPDALPDLAHLSGCAAAIVLSALLLPRHPVTVILTGLAFTTVTYFLQAVIRSYLDPVE